MSLPNGISFRRMALAGCTSVTDGIHTYIHAYLQTDDLGLGTCVEYAIYTLKWKLNKTLSFQSQWRTPSEAAVACLCDYDAVYECSN